MLFDLFGAIETVREWFGDDAELSMRTKKDIISVRITVLSKGEFHHSQIEIDKEERSDENIMLFNLKFRHALNDLKYLIDNYKTK